MEIEWVGLDLSRPVKIAEINLDRSRYYWCSQADMEERDPANLMRFFPTVSSYRKAVASAFYTLGWRWAGVRVDPTIDKSLYDFSF